MGEHSCKYSRDIFTEIVTLEYRPESGEGVGHLDIDGRERYQEESQQREGAARAKTLHWVFLIGKS